MPTTYVYESVPEWVDRHSQDGEPINVNGLIHFPTGAVCNPFDWLIREEPPNDQLELLRRKSGTSSQQSREIGRHSHRKRRNSTT